MLIDWFRGKTYTVKCPDGSIRTIQRDINDAYPLFVDGAKVDLGADIKGLNKLSAAVKAKYERQIEGTLFAINEQNQSLMMSFRTIYLTFTTNPCGNDAFFQREMAKILDEQRRLSALKLQLSTVVQLALGNPADTSGITKIFGDIAARIGGPASAPAATLEIEEARNAAKALIQNG